MTAAPSEFLTAEQRRVVEDIGSWLLDRSSPDYYLAGAAGVGKTALVKAIEGIGYHVAPTGKAAHVLRRKGVAGAQTLHKLLYTPSGVTSERLQQLQDAYVAATEPAEKDRLVLEIAAAKADARPTFSVNPDSAAQGAVVAVDECSMIGGRMYDDLMRTAEKVLWIGDPYQLPPVRDTSPFDGRRPDAELTQIMRQEAGSPIIQLATAVRNGGLLADQDYDDLVTDQGAVELYFRGRRDVPQEVFTRAGAIIVAKNVTRRRFNARMRDIRGYTGDMPELGERIVVLHNSYEHGVWNGGVYTVHGYRAEGIDLEDEAGAYPEVPIWMALDGDARDCPRGMVPADYGYALTCHKMQGSEADDVTVYAENQDQTWLYTAITRARRRVSVIIP